MANQGFGTMGGFGGDEFETVARQYWSAWGEMMRGGAAPAQPTIPGWNEAVAWWSQLAKGGHGEANEALDRFNTQARGWFGQMQQLAAQFAGRDTTAAEIGKAWKQALGGAGGNPFADVLRGMNGPGQQDFDQWVEQMRPYLEAMQRDGQGLLGMPTFGFPREHQERWQQLAQAYLAYQQASQAHNVLMAEASQDAFARFEDKLAERSEPGRQVSSARALFDLWIDAAEDAYAEIALSPRFRESYAALVNSQMRLRGRVQGEIEQATDLLGIPGRTEIDAAHRKIVQLEREVRRLRDAVQDLVAGTSVASSKDASPPAHGTASAAKVKPATTSTVAAKSTSVKQAPTKRDPAAKAAASNAVAKNPPERGSVATSAIASKTAPATPSRGRVTKPAKQAR